jgi:hypothetical protein
MSKQPYAANTQIPLGRMSDTAAYSARLQEAMRYDKLRSSDYPIVMTIMHAVSQGFTDEQWEKGQQKTVSILTKQPQTRKHRMLTLTTGTSRLLPASKIF